MSAIKLSTPSSGSISLSPANTASNLTITVPAINATMATLTTPSFTTTIGVGGATPAASGAGITFPATQSASSDANTLDDYEEGTWTPTSPVALSTTSAFYQKIGNTVFLNGFIDIGSNSNGASFIISGLPFAVLTGSSSVGCFNNANTDLYAYLDNVGIYIRNSNNDSRTCSSLSGKFVAFQLNYRTA
jgi:hypothetical protein